ncbi:Peptide deformylase [[Mycoplasma] cavipharyngis]|uniref:peptide deformylase n=1 Tax=[Mycoplasma] cavipharyngis TaxID=92757 RepID=UPI0037046F0D
MKPKLQPNNNWLIIDPHPNLRKICNEVTLPLSQEHQILVDKMVSFIDASYYEMADQYQIKKGIAIAAPQLNTLVRIIYIHFNEPIKKLENGEIEYLEHKYLLANPKIVSESVMWSYLESGEGCLSIDQVYQGYVYRKKKIVVEAYNLLQAKKEQYCMDGILSICFQHELDHLNGILYYDRINQKDPFVKKEGAVKY